SITSRTVEIARLTLRLGARGGAGAEAGAAGGSMLVLERLPDGQVKHRAAQQRPGVRGEAAIGDVPVRRPDECQLLHAILLELCRHRERLDERGVESHVNAYGAHGAQVPDAQTRREG